MPNESGERGKNVKGHSANGGVSSTGNWVNMEKRWLVRREEGRGNGPVRYLG